MNFAKQLEEHDVMVSSLEVSEQSEASNIINLPDHGFLLRKRESFILNDDYDRHRFSALNEW